MASLQLARMMIFFIRPLSLAGESGDDPLGVLLPLRRPRTPGKMAARRTQNLINSSQRGTELLQVIPNSSVLVAYNCRNLLRQFQDESEPR